MPESITIKNHQSWTQQEIHLILNKAFDLYQQGQYQDADILLDGLLSVDPANRYCHLAMSAVRASAGDLTRAVEILSQWIRFREEDIEARARRCELLFRLGRVEEARSDLDFLKERGAQPHLRRLSLMLES